MPGSYLWFFTGSNARIRLDIEIAFGF